MKSVLEETKLEKGTETRSCYAAACYGHGLEEAAKRIEKGVNDATDAVSEKLNDGRIAAERLVKRSRYAVEDGLEQAAHSIKRNPFSSIAIGFAAGAVLSFLVPRIAKK
ncbi:MAG: hypothetical protein LAO55_22345 [Acidobacteriia bacterium]|nr:hypothetical protein [Terriglobia bacterium]